MELALWSIQLFSAVVKMDLTEPPAKSRHVHEGPAGMMASAYLKVRISSVNVNRATLEIGVLINIAFRIPVNRKAIVRYLATRYLANVRMGIRAISVKTLRALAILAKITEHVNQLKALICAHVQMDIPEMNVKKRHAHLSHVKMGANVLSMDSTISLSAYARMGILVIRVKRKFVLS